MSMQKIQRETLLEDASEMIYVDFDFLCIPYYKIFSYAVTVSPAT